MGKNFEGDGRGLVGILSRYFPGVTEETTKTHIQDR
jgi:hypothetical protein